MIIIQLKFIALKVQCAKFNFLMLKKVMEEYKLIHATIRDPLNSYFTKSKTERASCRSIKCSNSTNCQLYARGECSLLSIMNIQFCPYGKINYEEGYTGRAHKYSEWIEEKKEKFKNVLNKLKDYSEYMAKIGEYVFLPYSFMNKNENVPFLQHGHFLSNGKSFIKLKKFTSEVIHNILTFRPRAMMGGEITHYQQKYVPLFVKHLFETFPKLYDETQKSYPEIKNILKTHSNIGRKALLYTLNPNKGIFIDIHKGEWTWDGEYLTSLNSKGGFMLISNFSEIKIKPEKNAIVKITSENQINKNTKFIN